MDNAGHGGFDHLGRGLEDSPIKATSSRDEVELKKKIEKKRGGEAADRLELNE